MCSEWGFCQEAGYRPGGGNFDSNTIKMFFKSIWVYDILTGARRPTSSKNKIGDNKVCPKKKQVIQINSNKLFGGFIQTVKTNMVDTTVYLRISNPFYFVN